jgi:hypothetical protein
MVISSSEATTSRLTFALEDSLQSLARLRVTAERMRPGNGGSDSAFETETLSVAELDRLAAVVRESTASLTRRLRELGHLKADTETESALGKLWRVGVKGDLSEPREAEGGLKRDPGVRPRSLVANYRAASRALCAALEEAKQSGDRTTAVLLTTILHRLEKQLWLLDSSRERPRIGLPLINLFLSC